jgi:hypothetical protein
MRKFRNIRLRKSPFIIERVGLINTIIRECINESFDSVINTDYNIINEGNITIYKFKTSSDNYYDLEFINSVEKTTNKLSNGLTLGDYLVGHNIITTDIAFVPSEINIEDRDNHELYTKETNRGEQIELMGRISYLVKEYIRNNPNENVFVIGKNTKQTKLNIYVNMFYNMFDDDYIKVEGENFGYDEGSFYFIDKKVLKI